MSLLVDPKRIFDFVLKAKKKIHQFLGLELSFGFSLIKENHYNEIELTKIGRAHV